VLRFLLLAPALTLTLAACSSTPPPAAPASPPRPFVSSGSPVDQAFANYAESQGLRAERAEVRPEYEWEQRPAQPAPPGITAEGLQRGEAIVVEQATANAAARTAFRTVEKTKSCMPAPETEYRMAQAADGTVVIVRLVPKITKKTEYHPGSCAVACGPIPVQYADLLALPETSHVRVETVTWDAVYTVVTCDEPYGMP
jgi:hypothetical protein